MGGKGDVRVSTSLSGYPVECSANQLDVRLNETRVVIELPQDAEGWCVGSDFLLRPCDVLTILAATGIRTIGRREEGKGMLDTIIRHLSHRVGKQRMPIAIAEIDR